MNTTVSPENVSVEALLAQITDEFLERLNAGELPNVEDYAQRYPHLADVLRQVLPALRVLRQPSSAETPAHGHITGVLGDFRILREVGRGGMGIVYEAEQISLGRRVALKVLPLAATMDSRRLQRFHNEARAAASLHQEHIAPVHAVGCERGVHFFAMQFINGQSLAEWIEHQCITSEPTAAYQLSANDHSSGVIAAVTPAPAALTTSSPVRNAAGFRQIAEWGMQAAEALEYAHSVGIVHRDIKPANLMVDSQGKLWVTDFGLAQTASDAGLTMTGDLLGTLRYMSPEQALARHGLVDHRTDVYSLGVTLYELLTLRPAVEGKDRQEILRRIAFEEPVPPRRLNKAIPAELEIIVLKAMEKRPQDRYATAQELADDLERWLKHEPIRARRPSLRQRAIKWGLRHKPVVGASLVVLLMALVLAGYIAWTRHDRALQRAAVAFVVSEALTDSQFWQQQRRLPEALSAAWRADGLLGGADLDETLRQQVQRRRADLELLNHLESVRLETRATFKDQRFDLKGAADQYAQLFLKADMDVESLPAEEAGERIARSTVAVELAAVLDDWAYIHQQIRGADDPSWKRLLRVACLADPDVWRTRVREALERKDQQALQELALSREVFTLSPATLSILGGALMHSKEPHGHVEAFLREAQRRHPNDYWLNHNLFEFFALIVQPPQTEEAYHFAAVAVALRPDSPLAHHNLGTTLLRKDCLDEAIAEYKEALHLNRDFAHAHGNLGAALYNKGQLDEAITECREAIRLKKDLPEAHSILGSALSKKGQVDEAITEIREAIRLDKDYPEAHCSLGDALGKKGQLDEAITEYREAIRLRKDYPVAHCNLGIALLEKGQVDEAITECREAIRLKQDLPAAHNTLGIAMYKKGQVDEAITEIREAIRIKKDYLEAHCNLGIALLDKGQVDEAITECREAIRLKKDFYGAHFNLARALDDKGQVDEAITEFREAIRLKKDDPEAHHQLGIVLYSKGQLDEAISEFREAIRINKDHAVAHCNLGSALDDKGQVDEAISEYREAIRLKKDDPEAHCNLGIVLLYKKGQLDEAITELREAIRLKKDYPEAHCELGVALKDKGRLAEAIAESKEALRLKPNLAEAHNNLAGLLAEASDAKYRDPPRAVELAKKAVELQPGRGAFWNTLGSAHYRAGQWKQAIGALKKSEELLPGKILSNNAFFLAMAHWQLGEKDQARQWYAKAVDWMDKNKPKDEELMRLRPEVEELLGIKTVRPAKESPTIKP